MLRNRGERTVRPAKQRALRPSAESLEFRQLMAIDVAFTAGPAPGPYGVEIYGNSGLGSDYGEHVSIVGDVNGDTFQDYVIANPQQGRVQLILASRPADYLTLTNAERSIAANNVLVDLGAVRGITFFNTTQVNPVTGVSRFGASVAPAGDVNGDGFADFMIGDPGALDINNTAGTNGTGKAYLVYGAADLLSTPSSQVDIESAFSVFGIRTLTLATTALNSGVGSAVSSAGSVFQENRPAISVGASEASLGNLAGNGALFVVANSSIPNPTTLGAATIDLARVGQGGTPLVRGMVLVGTESNGETGFSASYTDIDNDGVTDVMVGSPGLTGLAYVVYGTSGLLAKNELLTGGLTRGISLSRIGTADVPGIAIVGSNDATGYSVAFGGDFNGDGFNDMIVGSPNFGGASSVPTNAGRATLFYGSNSRYNGSISLSNVAGLAYVQYVGEIANAFTGQSVSATGYVNTDDYSEILLGAPGFASGVGRTYLIPGNPGVQGVVSLVNSDTNPFVEAEIITTTSPNVRRVGSGVSGFWRPRLPSRNTVDGDNLADILIGAGGGAIGGAAYLLEGAFITLPTPVSNVINTDIRVDTQADQQNYTVVGNSTTPLQIYVLSVAALPGGGSFRPVTDIVASNVLVDGIRPDTIVVSQSVPPDLNGDGIADALVTVTSRSQFFTQNGTDTLTISGLTPTSRPWQGSASLTIVGFPGPPVNGGNPPGGSSGSIRFNVRLNAPVNGERGVPTAQTLSTYFWKPLRYREAFQQFLPNKYFQLRSGMFNGTAAPSNVQAVLNHRRNLSNHANPIHGNRSVFMRDYTYPGIKVNHKVPTIPGRTWW